MGNFTSKHRWAVLMTFVLTVLSQFAHAQSGSTGSTFVHTGGEMGIFGQHNFQNGSGTISAGIIGSERQPALGIYSFVNPAGSWVGASDQAFVDGYVRTYNPGAFTFPIGDNGKYRPAAVSASSSTAPTTAAYYGVDPGLATTSDLKGGTYGVLPGGASAFATTSKASGVGTVDNIEYWDIDGTTPARITLTWDVATPIGAMVGSDLSKLTIVGWDGSQWVSIPSTVDAGSLVQNTSVSAFTGLAGTISAGSITTNAEVVPGSYTVYTLAETDVQTPCSLTVTASASQTAVCVGGSVNLTSTVTPAGSVTYSWSGPGGFASNQPNPTVNNIQPTGEGGALYTVTVTDAASCTASYTVSVLIQIPNVVITTNSPQCSGNTLAFQATSGLSSYTWTGPNGFSSNQPNPTLPAATTAATGSYSLVVTDALGCTASFVTSATIATAPSLTLTASAGQTVCSGQSTTLTVSGNNGAAVSWSNNFGQTGTGLTVPVQYTNAGSAPSQITYTIQAAAGTCQDSKTLVVTVNPEPQIQVIPTAAVYCDIEQVNLTANALPATATLNWTRTPNTPGTATGSGTGTVNIQQTLPAASYTYTFTATDVSGCSSQPMVVPVAVQQ